MLLLQVYLGRLISGFIMLLFVIFTESVELHTLPERPDSRISKVVCEDLVTLPTVMSFVKKKCW